MTPTTLPLLSGGLDSCVMLAHLLDAGHVIRTAIAFDYGQSHRIELRRATLIAERLGITLYTQRLDDYGAMIHGECALTGHGAIPDGHYTDETMKKTIVPMRNPMMLIMAAALAMQRGINSIAIAVHAGDHTIYPDCRPEFIGAMGQAIYHASDGRIALLAPFLNMTKSEIVARGHQLGAPMHLSWSCYKGGKKHCGTCGTCVERREAFNLAGINDETEYEA